MDKQAAVDKIWDAYKQKKNPPNKRAGRKREDIDNYQYDKILKSGYGRW